MKSIDIRGARTHNLKNLDLTLPRDQLIVFTGLSGSGKSNEPEDHLAVELEFMAYLGQKTIEALKMEDDDQGVRDR